MRGTRPAPLAPPGIGRQRPWNRPSGSSRPGAGPQRRWICSTPTAGSTTARARAEIAAATKDLTGPAGPVAELADALEGLIYRRAAGDLRQEGLAPAEDLVTLPDELVGVRDVRRVVGREDERLGEPAGLLLGRSPIYSPTSVMLPAKTLGGLIAFG
jgi:hypothetical protein